MGFFEKIKEGLKKTRDALFGRIDKMLKSFTKIDDELFEELGSKYLDPNFQQKIKDSEEEKIQEGRGDNIVLTKEAAAKKNPAAKKGCC